MPRCRVCCSEDATVEGWLGEYPRPARNPELWVALSEAGTARRAPTFCLKLRFGE